MKLGSTSASFEQPALTETLAKTNDALERNAEQHNPEQSNLEHEFATDNPEINKVNQEIGITNNDKLSREEKEAAKFERLEQRFKETKTLDEKCEAVLNECSKIDSKLYPVVNIDGKDYYKVQDTDSNGKTEEKYLAKGDHGEVDFSPVARATITMLNPGNLRETNFREADKLLAKKWNEEMKDGRSDWTAAEIRKLRKAEHLIWHEHEDIRTLQLVPQEFHKISHNGGKMIVDHFNDHKVDYAALYQKENSK